MIYAICNQPRQRATCSWHIYESSLRNVLPSSFTRQWDGAGASQQRESGPILLRETMSRKVPFCVPWLGKIILGKRIHLKKWGVLKKKKVTYGPWSQLREQSKFSGPYRDRGCWGRSSNEKGVKFGRKERAGRWNSFLYWGNEIPHHIKAIPISFVTTK